MFGKKKKAAVVVEPEPTFPQELITHFAVDYRRYTGMEASLPLEQMIVPIKRRALEEGKPKLIGIYHLDHIEEVVLKEPIVEVIREIK